ncbi:ATP-binding protein [Nonomuraea sp. NPDC050536]|uniref:sensor histidine kinase n=1 Tax=Nonomuraea sp. NPDC050536 TaxID=3364366 RepID=UPI0037C921F0
MVDVDFEAVFYASPVACAVVLPDLTFAAVNRAYEKVSGRSRDELVGKNMFEMFPAGPSGRGAGELLASLERVLLEQEADVMALQRYDVEVPGSPGVFEERYWSVINAPLVGPDGEVRLIIHRAEEATAFIQQLRKTRSAPEFQAPDSAAAQLNEIEAEIFARARDLQEVNQRLRRAQTKERQTTEAMRQAMEQQRDLVADTSHDLRNPITGLQIRLQDALSDPDADVRRILLAALRDADRLGDIVAGLLELANLEAGTLPAPEPVDLSRLVESELARLDCSLTIDTLLEPDVVVDCARIELARLLNNLLANAERHARSRITVSVKTEHDRAVLEVIDDGPGIPVAERENVFKRFYRRTDARRTDPDGTGLGLPIARQIAHAHGGTLHIGDHPDGTRMVLRLPLHRR